jgi:nicotinate-nucleotide adenylyltransferase
MILSPPHLLDGARWENLRVGLLGGSFNPPHHGHVHISHIALSAFNLDALWWIVTPQNPLKNQSELSFKERFKLCQEITRHPKIIISDIEMQIGTNLTWKTIKALKNAFPKTEFIWVTGIDNALTMHRWENWETILEMVPTAHIARPPALSLIENCPLRQLHSQNHHFIKPPKNEPLKPKNTYWLMQNRMVTTSSTEIRKSN